MVKEINDWNQSAFILYTMWELFMENAHIFSSTINCLIKLDQTSDQV